MRKNFFTMQFQRQLALLAVAFAFPFGGATLVMPWLLVLGGVQMAAERRWLWARSIVDYPIAAFLTLALLAGFLSPLPKVALASWVLAALAFVPAFQIAVGQLREAPELNVSVHHGFALGTLLAATTGLIVLYLGHTTRAQLPALGAQALGFGLMAGVFLTLPLLRNPSAWRWMAVLTIGVAGTTLIATFNRAALYGLVAGTAAYLLLERRRLPLRLFGLAFVGLLIGSAAALAVPTVRQLLIGHLNEYGLGVSDRISASAVFERAIGFMLSLKAHSDRFLPWSAALQVIRTHPWFGVGLGVYTFVVQQLVPQIPYIMHEHSIFLGMAAEVGIPGALVFVAIPLTAVLWGARHPTPYRSAVLAAMIAMLAAEVRDAILAQFHMLLGFVVVLAMLVTPGEGNGAEHHP